jgi:hypothetical protein
MTNYILHQNMRVYGGGSLARNDAYFFALHDIPADIWELTIAVGLTEITSNKDGVCRESVRVNLPDLVTSVNRSLKDYAFVACGTTSGGDKGGVGTTEYVGLFWNRSFLDVAYVGRTLQEASGQAAHWNCELMAYPGKGITMPLPKAGDVGYKADSRGLAFIVGAGKSGKSHFDFVIAFMHNQYGKGDKSGGVISLDSQVKTIEEKLKEKKIFLKDPNIYIGGDFNVKPTSSARTLNMAAASTATGFINTTNSNPYDYFLSNQNISNDDVQVHAATRIAKVSDHAGVSLKLQL